MSMCEKYHSTIRGTELEICDDEEIYPNNTDILGQIPCRHYFSVFSFLAPLLSYLRLYVYFSSIYSLLASWPC